MSRAMKDSGIPWIGEIPQDWQLCRIKNKFSTISGATPKTDDISYWDGDVIWVTPADYKTEDRFVIKGRRNITLFGVNSCGTTIVPGGSIIFSKRAPIGLVAVNKVPLCTNQGCISCLPKKECLNTYYYYIMSILTEQFELYGSGTTFKEISASAFTNFAMIAPSYHEQQAIADFLDVKCAEVDELIALQEKMIDELKVYKQSVITEAVTKGLNPDAPLKNSGIEWIGQIPKHWSVERLKNRIELNPSINPTKIDSDTIVSFMPMECLRNAVITPKTASYSDVRTYTPFQEQDIVMAKVTPCYENGNIAIATNLDNGFGFGTSEIFVIRCNQRINNNYLFYYLQSSYAKNAGIASMTGTGGLKRVNPTALSCSRLLCPPIEEQQQIANYLDTKCAEIDEMTNIKQQKIDQLKEYKKSIIYEYVTGKKQVNIE